MREILVIPDTQCKPGDDFRFLRRVGQYILEKRPDIVVHLGDHWDMESLSSYDKGKKCFEGRRYKKDITAGNDGLSSLMEPIHAYNRMRRKNGKRQYRPRMEFLLGNHEQRCERAIEADAILEDTIGYHDFNLEDHGWTVHDFLSPVTIEGICFSHYFYNPNSGKPFGGTAHSKLKNIGCTFIMGHQQGLDVAYRNLPNGTRQIGIVAGSCYEHYEGYRGPQANHHWRGVVYLHEVRNGWFDPMFVSLDYLKRRYG